MEDKDMLNPKTLNIIKGQLIELNSLRLNYIEHEIPELYKSFPSSEVSELLTILHSELTRLFGRMNERLPTNHNCSYFWADPSRELIKVIAITFKTQSCLNDTGCSFDIDDYYLNLLKECRNFLCSSGGSELPPNMDEVDLYYSIPIFLRKNTVTKKERSDSFPLTMIGEGSYATVHRYKDTDYNRHFVQKQAKKDLNAKELERFKREFEVMSQLNSPYIVEVFIYNQEKNSYTMEHMDKTLKKYIETQGNIIEKNQRLLIARQILTAFSYTTEKNYFHRDISYNNVLIKEYEDRIVVKISDFGLVKTPNSDLTAFDTEVKGMFFNDPALLSDGYKNYAMVHETYALTKLIHYVMTGKTNCSEIHDENLRKFVNKGLSSDKIQRFQSVPEMISALNTL